MINSNLAIGVMNDDDLLACTRELVRQSCGVEAELLLYLAEIDERKLYADRAFPSMLAFCMKELGFSEGAAYNRIGVARAARRLARGVPGRPPRAGPPPRLRRPLPPPGREEPPRPPPAGSR